LDSLGICRINDFLQSGQDGGRAVVTRRIKHALWFDTLRLLSLPPTEIKNHSGFEATIRTTEALVIRL